MPELGHERTEAYRRGGRLGTAIVEAIAGVMVQRARPVGVPQPKLRHDPIQLHRISCASNPRTRLVRVDLFGFAVGYFVE